MLFAPSVLHITNTLGKDFGHLLNGRVFTFLFDWKILTNCSRVDEEDGKGYIVG